MAMFEFIKIPCLNSYKDAFLELNPLYKYDRTENVSINKGIYKVDIFKKRNSRRLIPMWNITCSCFDNTGVEKLCNFIIKSHDISHAIDIVKDKIDTDVWNIISVYKVNNSSDDIIFTNYPVI